MLRSENVATPFTAFTVFVPDRVPAFTKPALYPIAMVTEPVKVLSVFPKSSTTRTCTGGVIVRSGNVVLGCVLKTRCAAAGLSASAVASHVLDVLSLKYQVH